MTEIIQAIRDIGIPAAIAVLVIFRLERKIDDLIKAVNELCKHISESKP